MTTKKVPYDYVKIACDLQKGLSTMQQEDACTDFEVCVGLKTFNCHKVVLASVSDFFKAMFDSGMKETIQNQATFEDVTPEAFEAVLDLLYPKVDVPNPLADKNDDDMSELLRLSGMLQMPFLKQLCMQYFSTTMLSSNCIERWKLAREELCDELQELAWSFLMGHFEDLAADEMLLSLDYDDFHAVIKDEFLCVNEESGIWLIIKNWIRWDEGNRNQYIAELIRHCCLTEIDPDYLIEEIAFHPSVRHNDKASYLVKSAFEYSRHKGMHGNQELKYRESLNKEQVLILLGKRKKGGTKDTLNTLCYSSRRNEWIWLRPLRDVGEGFSCCVHGGSIFVTGGSDGQGSSMYEYIGREDTWEKREKMIVPLKRHSMVAMDTCLFVVGGRSSRTINGQVLEYCFQTEYWRLAGEIMAPVENASSVSVGNKIYIFGGVLEDERSADSVQVYNVETKTATIHCHLPTPCIFSRSLVRGVAAYVVTSDGQVIKLSKDATEPELFATIPNFKRVNFGVSMKDNRLQIYGGTRIEEDEGEGEGEGEMLKEVTCVDISSGDVSKSKPLQFAYEVHGCANVVIPNVKPSKKKSAKK